MAFGLRVSPGATEKRRDGLTKHQVDALNEGGLNHGAQANLAQAREERAAFPPEHPGVGEGDPASRSLPKKL